MSVNISNVAVDGAQKIISYDQLVELVINALGKEGCEKICSIIGVKSLSNSCMLLNIFKGMGIIERSTTDNSNSEDWESELYHFIISDKARYFCVGAQGENIWNIWDGQSDRREIEIYWKWEVFSKIMEYISGKIGPVEYSGINIPVRDSLNERIENDSHLSDIIIEKTNTESIRKICLSRGYDYDEEGVRSMVNGLIEELKLTKLKENYQYNQYCIESISLVTNIAWKPEIVWEILNLIEEKTHLEINALLKKSLLSNAVSYSEERARDGYKKSIYISYIATLVEKGLDRNIRERLRKAIYGNEDKRNYIPQYMIRDFIHELGFIRCLSEEDEKSIKVNVCLTEKGKKFGVLSDHISLKFLGYKPKMISLVGSYIEHKLKHYNGEKEGDFISSFKIGEAINKEATLKIYEKTGVYNQGISQQSIESMKELGQFSKFYTPKNGPNRWSCKIITHPHIITQIIEYVVDYTISSIRNVDNILIRSINQFSELDLTHDKYYTVRRSTVKKAKELNLAAYIAKVINISKSDVVKELNSAAPNKLIENLFNKFRKPSTVRDISAQTALDCGVVATIAYHLDLEISSVISRLKSAPDQKVSQIFAEEWTIGFEILPKNITPLIQIDHTSLRPTVIVVKYNAGPDNSLYIRGDSESLSWESGVRMEYSGNNIWVWTTDKIDKGTFIDFKLLINNEIWSKGDNFCVPTGETTTICPSF